MPFPLTLKQTENQSFHQSYENLHWLFLRQNQYTKIWHNEVSNHLLLQYNCVKMRCLPTFMCLFSSHHFCQLLLQGAIHHSVNKKTTFAQLLIHLATALGYSSLIYGYKLLLQELFTGPSQATYALNKSRLNKRPYKSRAHFLILWELKFYSLLPQTLRTMFFAPNVKSKPQHQSYQILSYIETTCKKSLQNEKAAECI